MQLIVGGEVLPLPLARSLAGRCRVLWNQYRPSETAICATRAIECDVEKITIGCPLPNVSIHLLDAQLKPVPQGAVGEMYIGGAGVGLGYLRQPELNRACFLPDPFADGAHRWIYKREILLYSLRTAALNFGGGLTTKSKFEAFASSWERLNQCSGNARG